MAATLALPEGPLRCLVRTNTNEAAAPLPEPRPELQSGPTRPRAVRPQPPCRQRHREPPAIGPSAAAARPSPLPIGCCQSVAEADSAAADFREGRKAEQFEVLSDWIVDLLVRQEQPIGKLL